MGRTHRWLIYLGCVLGLALALLAYRAQWHYSEFPPEFAGDALEYPVHIEHYPAASAERLRFLAESWPPGATISVVDARGASHEVTLILRQGSTALVLTGLSGLVFLAAAAFFFAPRSDRPGVSGLFWITFLFGLSVMVGGVFFPRENPVLLTAFGLVQIACLALLPVVFVHLALTFPRRASILDQRRWIVPLLSASALAVFAWQAVVLLRYFSLPTVDSGARIAPAHAAADSYMIVFMLVGFAIFAVRGRRLELTRERNQVRWLLWGFAIGVVPYVLLRTVPALFGLPPMMPDYVDRVIELAIPLSFAMAVVRHQFLNIDVIIRRSLLYALLATVLVGVYLVAGVVFGHWLGTPRGIDPAVLPMILGLLAGIAFLPLRRFLGRWIDRTFFKLTYDRDLVLHRLDQELAGLAARRPLAEVLRREVAQALLPCSAAVVIDGAGGLVVNGDLTDDVAGDILARYAGEFTSDARLMAAPRSTSMPDVEDVAFPRRFHRAGFVLAQPLASHDNLGGLVLVGGRTNERRYVEPDLVFLAGCARVAAQHLERIVLMQAMAEETLARERLTELDQMKSEFLAHVAHDLRTPVTGITWSARNLRDGLAGPLTSDQVEYVKSIAQSGEHLNRLVSNLLEVSRLERADRSLDLIAVELLGVWKRAVTAIEPLAAAKNVTLTMSGAEQATLVHANGDKLIEVAVNLLDNAVKYTEPGSTVTVIFGEPDTDGQAVSVLDRGPGLGDQSPETLFGRFAQGAASPNSPRKGFGLGLHIVVTYLELMGGDLTAANRPDGGAVFTCRLPLFESAT